MKKLRLQFAIFFLLLISAVLVLLVNSYRQMKIEEKSLWEGISEKVYNQFQVQLSDLLNREDARSFTEYRFYLASAGESSSQTVKTRSPLSDLSFNPLPVGSLGYFQIDPDGSFSTPYLPPEVEKQKLFDEKERAAKQNLISQATQELRQDFKSNEKLKNDDKKIDLKTSSSKIAQSVTNVYPNPIQKKKAMPSKSFKDDLMLNEAKMTGGEKQEADSEAPSELARREVKPQAEALKTFEEQSQKKVANTAAGSSPVNQGSASPSISTEARGRLSPSAAAPVSLGRNQEGGGSGYLPTQKRIIRPPMNPVVVSPEMTKNSSVIIDPFQSRLSESYLIFYRKVWIDQKMYLQGFVVDLNPFFAGLMELSFENSDLASFASVRWFDSGKILAEYGVTNKNSPLLFERRMAYPLSNIFWQVLAPTWPQLSTRFYLNLLSLGILLLSTVGLYWIYRSSAAHIELSQKRQDFVSAVTHELKTPLTSIRMYSEMLEDDWVGNESKKKEYYRSIHQESQRLSKLIDHVLQLARLEKHRYSFNLKTEIPEMDLESLGNELQILAQREGFDLKIKLSQQSQPITYDAEAFKEVLLIFLENSIKFSQDLFPKKLELESRVEGKNWILFWRDQGPGIPETELEKVFEKFYRVENEMTRKTKGTGIGLAMAKMIVEGMHAKISAHLPSHGGLEIRIEAPLVG